MEFDYPKNVRFRCERCALCCGDTEKRQRTILLLKVEADDISQETSTHLEELAEKVDGFEPYVYRMKKNREGKCTFLNNKACTIYPIRPLICRFYPFQLRNSGANRYVFEPTDECPGIGTGVLLRKKFFDTLFRKLSKLMNKNSQLSE